MSWVDEALELLREQPDPLGEGGLSRDEAAELTSRLGPALTGALTLEETADVLAASALLLRASAVRGELTLPDWSLALRDMWSGGADDTDVVVVGLGETGFSLLSLLARSEAASAGSAGGASLRRVFLDTETSRERDVDTDTVCVVLENFPEAGAGRVPRYGELLRSSYRAMAGPQGLPPLIGETLDASKSARARVHVVVGVEDAWLALIPDLLFDLRSYLAWGRRGSCVLHLVTRPSPRLRGSYVESLEEIERTRPFDEAFVVYATSHTAVEHVAGYIQQSARVPELFQGADEDRRRGAFSSYGMSRLPVRKPDEDAQSYLSRLDSAFRSAAPAWVPVNVVLSEIAPERVFCFHPPDMAPDELLWKLCPELTPVPVEGVEPALWRVQYGLGLQDLRLNR